MPTSWPGPAVETAACSICNASTVCSRFVVGPWICTLSPTAREPSVRRIAATPIFPKKWKTSPIFFRSIRTQMDCTR
ncbi:MAG TPA: hypothetical protein VNO76_04875 [Thermoplasmata archaeon]|nr:hypothetical protein [Thermoplasmata archaeon]